MGGRVLGAVTAVLLVGFLAVVCFSLATSDPGTGPVPAVASGDLSEQSALGLSVIDPSFFSADVAPGGVLEAVPTLPAPTEGPLPVEVFGAAAATPAPAPVAVQTAPPATGPVRGDTPYLVPGTPQERGQVALESLPYPYAELGVTFSFQAYRGGLLGQYNPRSRHISIYVKRTQSQQGLRVTLAHELGHALDDRVNSVVSRKAYLQARGLSTSTPWLPCLACSDYASGAGDFAEVFALWVAGRGDFRSRLAGEPTAEGLRRLAPFFQPPSQRGQSPVAVTAPRAPATSAPRPAPVQQAPVTTPSPRPSSRNLIDGLLGG